METPPVHSLSFTGVISESKRIVRANYSHFIALSIFFLPLAFSILISPTLRLSGHHHSTAAYHHHHLLYLLTLYILSLSAIATITFSTHTAFHGNPISFSTSVKTLTTSFFPLISTSIVIHLLLFCISLTFLMLIGSIVMFAQNLGLGFANEIIDYNSIQFMWFSVITGSILLAILIYFHVNWSLAYVIVVAESKWGFSPLMRSSYLIKGMRSVSVLLLLYYGVFGSLMVMLYTNGALANGLVNLRSWPTVLLTVLGSYFVMMCMLMSTAGNAVLYMYCKAKHGELALEVVDQFAGYVDLPQDGDDEKVPLIVTVAAA